MHKETDKNDNHFKFPGCRYTVITKKNKDLYANIRIKERTLINSVTKPRSSNDDSQPERLKVKSN